MESLYFQIVIGSFVPYFILMHQLYRLCRMWMTNQGCDSGYGPLYLNKNIVGGNENIMETGIMMFYVAR